MSTASRKRYPLQQLLQLRSHRTEKARRVVVEKQRVVRECREACARIEAEIEQLRRERAGQRLRMLDPPPPGIPFPLALEQREAHIDWLGEQEQAAQQRLQQAKQVLKQAEQALAEAMQAFFHAKAREDALEQRKGIWRGEVIALEARREEDAAADLVQAAHIGRTRH
ncbi:MAG TPA: YscO family type III secretion system apparatus protein [Luteimonas sp.]|nr:YscO family type III secretion system apparatus protein [Luteimonas sp.]HRP72286.1 YscO family type III secretion system apparatus protein [Luteimonas sp.]